MALAAGKLANWYVTQNSVDDNKPATVLVLEVYNGGANCTVQAISRWRDPVANVALSLDEIYGEAIDPYIPFSNWPTPVSTALVPTAGCVSEV